MEFKIPPKKIILSLLSIIDNLNAKYNNHSEYSEILKYLASKNFYYDEELPIPSIKEISLATGLKEYQTRKRIRKLYELIFDEDSDSFINFNKTEYVIYASRRKKSVQIKVKTLAHIPKIGEDVNLDIMYGMLGTPAFYVQDIWHSFEQGKQTIYIILKDGSYSLYWHIKKEEAEMKGELSFDDIINMSEFDMKRKLGLR